jgi:hypothetical protein
MSDAFNARHGVDAVVQASGLGRLNGLWMRGVEASGCGCGSISRFPPRYTSHDLPGLPLHAAVPVAVAQ